MNQPVVVLYDGQCPLCSREIAHYRRRNGAERIRWVDATAEQATLRELGISAQQALARFHVRAADGAWITGAAAFAELWSQLPAYAWLARLVRGLHLLPLMERAYGLWLRRRAVDRCGTACSSDRGSGT